MQIHTWSSKNLKVFTFHVVIDKQFLCVWSIFEKYDRVIKVFVLWNFSPEEKIKALEKKVNELIEESCLANGRGEFQVVSGLQSSYSFTAGWINPLRAKFFRGNINIYLHFMSLLHIDQTQVLKILPRVRPGPTYTTLSISWLLMSWRRKEPGHQQPWYWRS